RCERRRAELEKLSADPESDYHGDKKALSDPDEYRSVGAFLVPEDARWDGIVKQAQADDIKVRLDNVLELLEKKYRTKLEGLLPRGADRRALIPKQQGPSKSRARLALRGIAGDDRPAGLLNPPGRRQIALPGKALRLVGGYPTPGPYPSGGSRP